jgi:hypothetical protein
MGQGFGNIASEDKHLKITDFDAELARDNAPAIAADARRELDPIANRAGRWLSDRGT